MGPVRRSVNANPLRLIWKDVIWNFFFQTLPKSEHFLSLLPVTLNSDGDWTCQITSKSLRIADSLIVFKARRGRKINWGGASCVTGTWLLVFSEISPIQFCWVNFTKINHRLSLLCVELSQFIPSQRSLYLLYLLFYDCNIELKALVKSTLVKATHVKFLRKL